MKQGTQSKTASRLWKGQRPATSVGGRLLLCALAAAIAVLAWVGARLLPGQATRFDSPVVIRRVMTSNPSACYSVRGRYYDWLELVNLTDEAVNLKGWKLSDDADLRGAFAFGDITLPGRGSLIVYCADRPADLEGSQVFCGFKLSSDGELLVLSDRGQRLAQTLEVPAMGASDVYQRGEDGEYSVISFDQMVSSGAVDLRPAYRADGLSISELMCRNKTILTDEDGDHSDWIELYNGASEPVDLAGCALSDDDVNQRKWVLPDVTMQPGEYLLVFASGKDRLEGQLHANFKLSKTGEAVRLYGPEGDVLSWVEYDSIPKDASMSRLPDGSFTTQLRPTPGFENTELGARAALSVAGDNPMGLYINEIMCSGSGYDWLELYNGSGSAVDLSGMGLSDSVDHPRRWQFPAGASIPAGGYMTVALTGKEGQTGQQNGMYGANFALSAGETACLSRPDGTLLDTVTLFDQYREISYGRAEGEARFRYFTTATPGAKNAAASYERKAADIVFSENGGCHAEKSLTVALSSDPDTTIYYTTDGSEPGKSSATYTGPIELDKSTVVKAVAWRDDLIPSETAVRSFLLGASHNVRVVSVTGRRSRLNGSNGMLNTGVKGEGTDVYVEIYEPDGTQLIGQKCLMKLAGRSSRIGQRQKGFSLREKKEYGVSRFNAALFSNRDYDWYKSIVMRASGQDCFQTHMRDSVLTALAADTSVMYQETEVCVLYVNGKYWGLYNMRERVTEHSIAQFEGWDNPDDVEIAQGYGTSNANYMQMLRWVRSHDLSKEANLEKLRQIVDVENYLDYIALQIYTCNEDLNNVKCYRNPNADGKWRWIIFDLDLSFQVYGDNVKDWLSGSTAGSITAQTNLLFKRLMGNPSMKDYFLTRMGQLLATTFSVPNVTAKIQERYDLLLPEMPAHCKRWDWNINTWKRYGKKMVRYAAWRSNALIDYLIKDFHLSDAQAEAYFGEAKRVNAGT